MASMLKFREVKNPPELNKAYFDKAADVAAQLEANSYQFASTMASIPHSYTLQRRWRTEKEFTRCIAKMRDVERVEECFRGWWHKRFTANGFKYWTMGAKVEETILVNRTFHRPNYDPYAATAAFYDDLMHPDKKTGEAAQAAYREMDLGRDVLDIGCGTGHLVDFRYKSLTPNQYAGIDISGAMIQVFGDKHWAYRDSLVRTSFEDYYPGLGRKFDLIVALGGSASYLGEPEHVKAKIDWLLRPGGRAQLTYYQGPAARERQYRAMGAAEFGTYSEPVSGEGWEEVKNLDAEWHTMCWRKPNGTLV